MHRDTSDKLLSVVIYLKPEKNTGTILYENQNGDNPMVVEWKPNRAFIFSRSNDSWHAFKGDGINDRYTLLINITTELGVKSKRWIQNYNEEIKKNQAFKDAVKARGILARKIVKNVEKRAKTIE